MSINKTIPYLDNELPAQQLASLLASRICHDLISPVSALNNALELLEDIGAESDIIELLQLSAKSASYKLQFARMCFGASGDLSAALDYNEVRKVANNFIGDEDTDLIWLNSPQIFPKNNMKLLLNLLLIAKESSAKKRAITVNFFANNPHPDNFEISVTASKTSYPHELDNIGQKKEDLLKINAHTIQQYYSLLLAKNTDSSISITQSEQKLTFAIKRIA